MAIIRRKAKEESKLRKQARRLRRQFENLKVGDVVSGHVSDITLDGILINIDGDYSGGVTEAFKIRGLIKFKDLPKKFELPGLNIVIVYINIFLFSSS